jgi:hypothetical protein
VVERHNEAVVGALPKPLCAAPDDRQRNVLAAVEAAPQLLEPVLAHLPGLELRLEIRTVHVPLGLKVRG